MHFEIYTYISRKLFVYSSLQVRHIYICDFHKNVIQNVRIKRKRKDSDGADSPDNDFDLPEVNTSRIGAQQRKPSVNISLFQVDVVI